MVARRVVLIPKHSRMLVLQLPSGCRASEKPGSRRDISEGAECRSVKDRLATKLYEVGVMSVLEESIHSRPRVMEVVWAVALILAYVALVLWFNIFDFYHQNFFDHGSIVFADNLARVVFLIVFSWLIYVPGAVVVGALVKRADASEVAPIERAVLGFGIGAGLWQVTMLVLGVAGLYYRSVMIGLVAVVLLVSARQFGRVADSICRTTIIRVAALRRGVGAAETVSGGLIVVSGIWLLIARGLYPGGGGDYFTHYFYYNLEVLNNRGLVPNDVWYHYYYSKGYGLHFLGMLLTDPEAPALVTFCCIMFAAVAMAALAKRIAPGTFWPASVAVLYFLFYVVCISARGGGELQKGHELMAALIVMAMVGLCMPRGPFTRAWVTMAAACSVAVAIIAQPFGMLMSCFFAFLAVGGILRRRWSETWRYVFAGGAVGGTVGAMFALSYLATGLANDQALDVMLRFADIQKLDRWGVLPQLAIASWIRDNYSTEALLPLMPMLSFFMRLDQLWVVIAAALTALFFAMVRRALYKDMKGLNPSLALPGTGTDVTAIFTIGSFLVMAAIISALAAGSQPTSFERASTFFFPLLLLFAAALSTWATARAPAMWQRFFSGWRQPVVLVGGTLVLWAGTADWTDRFMRASENGLRFFVGRYSLADAYSHLEEGGFAFGGINPQALAAAKQVAPNTRIWSTTIDAYCMVPGCWIESVVSFKMSGKLDEIVTSSPDRAKQLLAEAGINYFLVMKDGLLLDLLPYSRLFAPETIGDYLGIKWTDGSAFLLGWKGPGVTPITPEFLEVYREMLRKREHPWFRFSRLVPQLPAATTALRTKPWGVAPEFPWRAPPPDGTVNIVEATFGGNCRNHIPKPPARNHFREGNATEVMREACVGMPSCAFRIDYSSIPDPANGCEKDFVVRYRCQGGEKLRTVTVPKTADYKTVRLSCSMEPQILQGGP